MPTQFVFIDDVITPFRLAPDLADVSANLGVQDLAGEVMTGPITPGKVLAHKQEPMPDGVLESFNALIAKHFRRGSSCFTQKEALKAIMAAVGCGKNDVFRNHWLDVEEIYEAVGWTVKYDNPAYNESYEPTFIFTASSTR